MKKKLLLLGALAILSTGSYGIDMETYGMLHKTNLENFKKTENMINSVDKLGATVVRDKVSESNAIKGFGKAQEADQKAQSEAFDVVAGAVAKNKDDIATNKGNIEKNKNTIASVGRLVSDTYRNHNDAASGMKESVEKHLGEFEHSVAANGTTNGAVAGKVQAEAFDVVTGAVAKNKNDIKGIDGKVESNSQLISGNQQRVNQTEVSISEIKSDFSKHALEAEKRDQIQDEHIEKLKDADIKFAEADKKFTEADSKFTETDKQLKEKDVKIEANIAKLHNHDSAIYEDTTSYAVGAEPLVKADVNRAMIEGLEGDLYVTDDNGEVVVDENGNKTTQLDEFRETSYEAITSMNEDINKNSKRIDGLEKKVDGLESKMNKGLAMAAATSSIVYPHLGRGDVGIGAGMGGYGGSQAIAIGVAMQPTENVRINTNVSTSDTSDTMYGAGVGYKFNIFGS